MAWFELAGDARINGRCASEGCAGQPMYRLEAYGVGSNYCSGCKTKIQGQRIYHGPSYFDTDGRRMERDKYMIESSIAQTTAKFLEPMGTQGLLDFLRKQVVDEQWKIARAQATIAAYEKAIAAIEAQYQPKQ